MQLGQVQPLSYISGLRCIGAAKRLGVINIFTNEVASDREICIPPITYFFNHQRKTTMASILNFDFMALYLSQGKEQKFRNDREFLSKTSPNLKYDDWDKGHGGNAHIYNNFLFLLSEKIFASCRRTRLNQYFKLNTTDW